MAPDGRGFLEAAKGGAHFSLETAAP